MVCSGRRWSPSRGSNNSGIRAVHSSLAGNTIHFFAFFLAFAERLLKAWLFMTEDHQAFRDIPYAKYGEREVVLNVFLPLKPQGPLPVLLVIAGGGWRRGSNESTPVRYTKRGFAMVGICYRGSGEVIAPGNIHDCKAAVRWIRAHAKTYGFDPDRIGAMGSSAGGHLVGLLATSSGVPELEGEGGNPGFSSEIQAACDVCGPCDLTRITLPNYKERYASLYQVTSEYLGGPVEERLDLARLVSPLTYVSKNTPPIMLIHGDVDDVVPLDESLVFYDALKKAGCSVGLKVLPGISHGNINWDEEDETIQSFFERIFMPKCQ